MEINESGVDISIRSKGRGGIAYIPQNEFVDTTRKLESLEGNWDFVNSNTQYLTHNFHPYPARFIPQIPHKLIKILSEKGDTILDPMCGCGTTLVESVLLDRKSIGTDINPLACLITKVKITPLKKDEIKIINDIILKISQDIHYIYGQKTINGRSRKVRIKIPPLPNIDHWFQKNVQCELAIIKSYIDKIESTNLKDFFKVAFSSIIVKVSNQDSDTRYVARDKKIPDFYTFNQFEKKLFDMKNRIVEFKKELATIPETKVLNQDARKMKTIRDNSIDLIITSPPYANAYDYHLYHKYRLLWLGMQLKGLKKNEIGAHAKYSSKNGKPKEEYFKNMKSVFGEMNRILKKDSYCCVVIGNSIIKGEIVENNVYFKNIAEENNFAFEKEIVRNLNEKNKSFVPRFGNIKQEFIMFFRKVV